MYHLRDDTFAGFHAYGVYQHLDFGDRPLAPVVGLLGAALEGPESIGSISVEDAALKFYLLNHADAMLKQKYHPHETLGAEARVLLAKYRRAMLGLGYRLMLYTLAVCTRESRHLHKSVSFRKKVAGKYGSVYCDFRDKLPHSSAEAVKWLIANPPDMKIGDYAEAMAYVFTYGSWGGGYGGKPWGNIARTLARYVRGAITLETFIDTAWTLAHNNGPMFNKGILFNHYTSVLITILDVQSSGQIPHLTIDLLKGRYPSIAEAIPMEGIEAIIDLMLAEFPELNDAYIDWELVSGLGASKKSYGGFIKEQKKWAKLGNGDIAASGKEGVPYHLGNGAVAIKYQRSA